MRLLHTLLQPVGDPLEVPGHACAHRRVVTCTLVSLSQKVFEVESSGPGLNLALMLAGCATSH